ncbi:hypothetical protein FB192DRAFT_1271391, partial [Mucor lusitanicus]
VEEVNGRVGTRAIHFLELLDGVLTSLDQNGMTGRHIVMDNAPIHKTDEIRNYIQEREYKTLYRFILMNTSVQTEMFVHNHINSCHCEVTMIFHHATITPCTTK